MVTFQALVFAILFWIAWLCEVFLILFSTMYVEEVEWSAYLKQGYWELLENDWYSYFHVNI